MTTYDKSLQIYSLFNNEPMSSKIDLFPRSFCLCADDLRLRDQTDDPPCSVYSIAPGKDAPQIVNNRNSTVPIFRVIDIPLGVILDVDLIAKYPPTTVYRITRDTSIRGK